MSKNYLVSVPDITVKVVLDEYGKVRETYTAWTDMRGMQFSDFIDTLRKKHGRDLIFWEL